MITNYVFRHQVSLGALDGQPGFGRGFNAVILVTAPGGAAGDVAAWVARHDHRHLGLDLDLGFMPALNALAADLLKALPTAVRVEIQRGDGVAVSCSRRR